MPHKLRKSRKQRGSRTCGYGKVGQHRDQGSKPERKAGRHKHKWSYVLRYEPDYFSKTGFTCPRSLRRSIRTINVGELDRISKELSEREGGFILDLQALGYDKLLGTGRVTKALTVKVPSWSKSASRKITDAGGEILAEAEGEKEE
jgi:large subunit ribosomal protein L15